VSAYPYNLIITLSPSAKESMKDTLLTYLEIEILQGEVVELPSGATEYRMNVDGEKAQVIKGIVIDLIRKNNYNAN